MEYNKRIPVPESTYIEYLVTIVGGFDGIFCPLLSGISYPNPQYEVFRTDCPLYILEYVISGKGTVTEDGQTVYPKAGDVYILHFGKNHHYSSDPSDPWQKIWINISGSLVGDLLRAHRIESPILFPGFNDGSYMERMLQAAEQGGDTTGKIALILHEFIAELSNFMNQKSQNPAYIMRDYINRNLDKNISIDELCSLIHHSKSRTIQLFSNEFGVTPYVYIMNSKAQMATMLLEKTDLRIGDVSQRLGFSNPHNFSAFYKKITGMTPTECRMKRLLIE